MLLVFPSFGEDVSSVRFSLSPSVPDDGAWIPPDPAGSPVLEGIPDGGMRNGIHYGSIALTAAGGLLCAGGIVVVARGLSDDMNSDTMHTGALMIISGALTAAIFTVVLRATGQAPARAIAEE